MKDHIYAVLEPILLEHMPEHVGEIGTHKGITARQIIESLAPRLAEQNKKLHYTGYDIFDHAVDNPEFNELEINGKGGAVMERTEGRLKKYVKRYDNFSFELNKGFTTDTLTSPQQFDFVYIDGGHSYDTVKHDYSMVKESKVILFDDLNLPPVLQFVNELIESGVDVKTVTTPSKHVWGLIVNK